MRRTLLAAPVLVSVGLAASPAWAVDGVQLGAGGYFQQTYVDDGSDAWRAQNIDGFGEVRAGSGDGASASACIRPPGGTSNFSAFSPDQWNANANVSTSNGVCSGPADQGDAQQAGYVTPNFDGFQLSLSYRPSDGGQGRAGADTGLTQLDGSRAGIGLNDTAGSRNNVAVYGTYSYEGDGWGLTAGAGGSWESHVEQALGPDGQGQNGYQVGINLNFGNFGVGGAFQYFDNVPDRRSTSLDRWVAGIGAGYTIDDWTLGLQYSHLDQNGENPATADALQQDRLMLTGNYTMAPGVNLDGELGYTWVDTDPHNETAGAAEVNTEDAFEIGIGTNFTF